MHEGEFDVDLELVRRLIESQFPQWASLPLKAVASAGTDNALFRIGDEMVVRLPRIDWAIDGVMKEQIWLPRIAPALSFEIPVPVALGEPTVEFPYRWSIYRWCEGENPILHRVETPEALAVDLAQFITELRGVDTAGAPLATRGIPLQERDAPTRKAMDELRSIMDISEIEDAWITALAVPPWTKPPVWVHADITPGNILVVDGRLQAIIDFGATGIGDPAVDLIVAWNLLPREVRPIFRARAGVDDATWKRGRGWALSIALIALPYYLHSNPTVAENARHVIAEALTDHRSEPG